MPGFYSDYCLWMFIFYWSPN